MNKNLTTAAGVDEGEYRMNVHMMTPQQIRVAGLAALSSELGLVGMIRFMQQFELGADGALPTRWGRDF